MQFCSQIMNNDLSYIFYTATNVKRLEDGVVRYSNRVVNIYIYVEFCKEDSRLPNSGERHLSVYTKQKVQGCGKKKKKKKSETS